ncbi:hypothetical protein LTS18_006114, partial [Coniosporium uncinatum]
MARPSSSSQELGRKQRSNDESPSATLRDSEAWQGEQDPRHPYNWPSRKKWIVIAVACFACFIAGINATSVAGIVEELNVEFSINDHNSYDFPFSYFTVTAWNLGAAFVPMFVLPLMEDVGVRWIYIGTYLLFTLFIIPQALARNFATLIVTRFICGCAGGVLQNIIDGIAANLWEDSVRRSLSLTLYVLMLIGGVTFGPVFAGAVINHDLNWR